MKPIDQTHLHKKYPGKWVALTADRRTVITSGANPVSVRGVAEQKGCKTPIITKVPRKLAHFIGFHLPA